MARRMSPEFSMFGFNILTLLKKRKKTIIASLAAVIMYLITDAELASIMAGFLIEALIGVGEFYFKKVDLFQD